jgi:hypothetical protein
VFPASRRQLLERSSNGGSDAAKEKQRAAFCPSGAAAGRWRRTFEVRPPTERAGSSILVLCCRFERRDPLARGKSWPQWKGPKSPNGQMWKSRNVSLCVIVAVRSIAYEGLCSWSPRRSLFFME